MVCDGDSSIKKNPQTKVDDKKHIRLMMSQIIGIDTKKNVNTKINQKLNQKLVAGMNMFRQ